MMSGSHNKKEALHTGVGRVIITFEGRMVAPREQLRVMTREEVVALVPKIYQEEGWSYGLHDFACTYDFDPTSFLCYEVDGKIVGTASAIKWDANYAFTSALYVHPEYRKKGYGVKLALHMGAKLTHHNIGQDALENLVSAYEKAGFIKAYTHHAYHGIAKALDHPLLSKVCDFSKVPFADLIAYDSKHFPVSRGKFLEIWTQQPRFVGKVFLQDGQVLGFGALKEGWPEHTISPLFAATPEIASAIAISLTQHLQPGEKYEIIIHSPNPNANELIKALGLEQYFPYVRMYNKRVYTLADSCVYACTSADLG